MEEITELQSGMPPISGKSVHTALDGGQLTNNVRILVLAEIDRRLGISERLAACIEDRRDPERVRHSYAEVPRRIVLDIDDTEDPAHGA